MSDLVVIGAGIIGGCSAFYLSKHAKRPAKLTLIEASTNGVAFGASGKAGGLVAKWAYPRSLVDVSFQEHETLAKEFGHRYGWRYVNCGTLSARGSVSPSALHKGGKSLEKEYGLEPEKRRSAAKVRRNANLPADLDWVNEEQIDAYSAMAPLKDTAQVHPRLFTTTIIEEAQKNGVELITSATVMSIQKESGRVTGVVYEKDGRSYTLNCDKVLVTAGAWSPSLIKRLPISATRAHSVVIKADVSPYVLFTEITTPGGLSSSPEIYARPDGTAYACGPGDDAALPPTVDDVKVDEAACQAIISNVASISENLKEGSVVAKQACYLPLGGPLIGHMPSQARGLYVATGHTCWGISNGPGTGKAIAELILDGKITCADLSRLKPE